jgi:hypothetical protein
MHGEVDLATEEVGDMEWDLQEVMVAMVVMGKLKDVQ